MPHKILIYGASGGIGSATARILRGRGHDLHLVGRNAEKLAALAAELGVGYTAGDVTDAGLFARVAEEVGGEPLAGLAYAVGTLNLRSFSRLAEADFRNDLQVNAIGVELLTSDRARAFEPDTAQEPSLADYDHLAPSRRSTLNVGGTADGKASRAASVVCPNQSRRSAFRQVRSAGGNRGSNIRQLGDQP